MNFNISLATAEKKQPTCMLVGVFEDGELTETAKKINKMTQGYINKVMKQGLFQGKIGQILPLLHLENTSIECLILVGCGKPDYLTPSAFRKIMSQAMRALCTASITEATCYFTELAIAHKTLAWKVKHLAEAAKESVYRFDLFKSDKEPAMVLKELIIHLPETQQLTACKRALQQGLAIADGVMLAKNLGNLPSNICTPTLLADKAKELAKRYASIKTTVLSEKDMQKLGMGALLAVSQGSAEEAKLICLE